MSGHHPWRDIPRKYDPERQRWIRISSYIVLGAWILAAMLMFATACDLHLTGTEPQHIAPEPHR